MWIVFYDDGTTFSNKDGTPCQAPPAGVIVLLQTDADGKNVLYTQRDYYCWEWRDKNEWVICDQAGYDDYRYNHTGEYKSTLFGRWTTNENYERIWNEANEVWRSLSGTTEEKKKEKNAK